MGNFDDGSVVVYRLLGFENRAVHDVAFRNDDVDAGEPGSGHQVAALYGLELAKGLASTSCCGSGTHIVRTGVLTIDSVD